MDALVSLKEPEIKKNPNILLLAVATFMIYSMIVPYVICDIWTNLYQIFYFKIMGIPTIDRREYFTLDRGKLSKLNVLQKTNCVYCGYINGLVAWQKAVANQTELYSCAIKHKEEIAGQEHHEEFFEYEEYL